MTTAQIGHVLSGVGAKDQGMSGAGATSRPLDAMSAMYWNPAGLSLFDHSTIDIGLQFLTPEGSLHSAVTPGAFGPSDIPSRIEGSTESTAGPFPIPAFGYLHVPENSKFTIGFSAFGVGGFGVDYQANTSNPITNRVMMGFGPVESEFQLIQATPTIAYQINRFLHIGFAPIVNYSALEVTPFPATSPDDANNDGVPSYPEGPKTGAWGWGYQTGLIAHIASLNIGISYKSTQRFNDLAFDSRNEAGTPRTFSFNLDYPAIFSAGLSYVAFNRLLLAADYKHIDFEDTDGFSGIGYDATGAVKGFGWESIDVWAAGLEYGLTDNFTLRSGYAYNDSPVIDELTFFNVSSPAIIKHHISGGLSYQMNHYVEFSFAYQYGFENSCNGNWIFPASFGGENPATTVSSNLRTQIAVIGMQIRLP